MFYRKIPVTIEAIQWTGDNMAAVKEFSDKIHLKLCYDVYKGKNASDAKVIAELFIPTLEGDMHAAIGDYIIKGIDGEVYPCKPTYLKEHTNLLNNKKKVSLF